MSDFLFIFCSHAKTHENQLENYVRYCYASELKHLLFFLQEHNMKKPVSRIRISFNASPYPPFNLNADPDPDQGNKTNADQRGSGSWSDFSSFQNFIPHIKIMKFCQNQWSLLRRALSMRIR